MQPIWEFFYKNVIGHSTTSQRKDLPGSDFEERGNYWDSIVNVKVVANLSFLRIQPFFLFQSFFVIRMIYDHGSYSNWVLTYVPSLCRSLIITYFSQIKVYDRLSEVVFHLIRLIQFHVYVFICKAFYLFNKTSVKGT